MALGTIADDDRDLPGEDLRTSHAKDVGLHGAYNYTLNTLPTRGARDEVHNSRRPLDRLTLTPTLTSTFDRIFIRGRGIMMDYPSAKFDNFSFSRFGFIVQTHIQAYRQNHRIRHYTHATTTGVSKDVSLQVPHRSTV